MLGAGTSRFGTAGAAVVCCALLASTLRAQPTSAGERVIAAGHEQAISRASAVLARGDCAVEQISMEGGTVTIRVTCGGTEHQVMVLPVEPSGDAGRRRASGDLWVLVTPDEGPWVDELLARGTRFAASLPADLYIAPSAEALPSVGRAPGFDVQTSLALSAVALLLLVIAFVRRGRGDEPSKPSSVACLLAALYLLGSVGASDRFPFSGHRASATSPASDSAPR